MKGFTLSCRLALGLSLVMGSTVARPTISWAEEVPAAGIFGRISLGNGNGVSGVSIRLGDATTAAAKTNGDGKYQISHLAAGRYIVKPIREGFRFSPETRTVVLPTSGKPTSPRAEANFAATRIENLVLTGLIRTPQGTPVAEVVVALTGDKFEKRTAKTNAQGIFRFENLPYGRFTATPSKAGFTFDPQQRSINLPSTNNEFAPNGRANFIAKSVAPLAKVRIFGRVTDDRRQPVAGVAIFLNDRTTASATTDADGKYSIGDLAAGHYVVTPKQDGATFAPAYRGFDISGEPNASHEREANFTLKNPVSAYVIRGRVTNSSGEGIAGVVIVEGEGNVPRATTGPEGRYEINGLTAGRYVLKAQKEGAVFAPETRVVELPTAGQGSSPNGEANFTQQTPISTFAIRGRVTNPNGQGLAGVSIRIGDDVEATTNSEGRYAIEGLEAGSYTLSARKDRFTFDPTSKNVTLPVVEASSPDAEVNFVGTEQPTTYYIFGTVKTSAGVGVAGVKFTLGDGSIVRATTDSNGSYSIVGLAPGTYVLHPHLDGTTFTPASATVTLPGNDGTASNNAKRDFVASSSQLERTQPSAHSS